MFRAIVNGPEMADEVIVVGTGLSGKVVAKEGDPSPIAGRNYGPLDGQFGINDVGHYVFGTRLDGSTADNEIIFRFDGTAIVKAVRMGDPAPGLTDDPPGASGNELFGPNLDSAHILNDGRVAFQASNIQNAAITRNTALYHGNTVLLQEGAVVGMETIHSFFLNTFRGSALGEHYIVMPDIDLTDVFRQALVVDGALILRQGDTLPEAASPITNLFGTEMTGEGTWFTYGQNLDLSGFVLRGSTARSERSAFDVIARSGAPIYPGSSEQYRGPTPGSSTFRGVTGNAAGHYVIVGFTDHPDAHADLVIVWNGFRVVLREGDPVDLNENGMPDDDAEIHTFVFNPAVLTADRLLYAVAQLRTSKFSILGTALLVADLHLPCKTDAECDDAQACTDDFCIPGSPDAGADGCVHLVVIGGPCEDGNPCTVNETCDGTGRCLPGGVRNCTDDFVCTIDQCDPGDSDADENGCVHKKSDERCNDNNECMTEECNPTGHGAGSDGCVRGPVPGINDGIGCTLDGCNPATGEILHTPDDGRCGDGFDCTVDCCDPMNPKADDNGCLHEPDNGKCVDSDLCTDPGVCDPSSPKANGQGCVFPPRPGIDDGYRCTDDFCDPSDGDIRHDPVHSRCASPHPVPCQSFVCDPEEENPDADGCVTRVVPGVCNDEDPCTADACDPLSPVAHPLTGCTFRDVAVSDGVPCTLDSCDPETGAPVNTPDHRFCDDDDPCTDDICDPTSPDANTDGCIHRRVPRGDRICGTGDHTGDGATDMNDLAGAVECLSQSGPGVAAGESCAPADRDGDQDVDLQDVRHAFNVPFICDPTDCQTVIGGKCVNDCAPGESCIPGDERAGLSPDRGGGGRRPGHCACQHDGHCSVGRCEHCMDVGNGPDRKECRERCDPMRCEGPCDGRGTCPQQCRENETCVGGRCKRRCVLDRECNLDACEECRDRACVSRCAEGEVCVRNRDGTTNCRAGCRNAAECPECHDCKVDATGLSAGCIPCEASGLVCRGGLCVRACSDERPCSACERCVKGACINQCPEGEFCHAGRCRTICSSREDCGECQACLVGVSHPFCVECLSPRCLECNEAGDCFSRCQVLNCQLCDGAGNCVSRCRDDERCDEGVCRLR